jgi:hypothetical protein
VTPAKCMGVNGGPYVELESFVLIVRCHASVVCECTPLEEEFS